MSTILTRLKTSHFRASFTLKEKDCTYVAKRGVAEIRGDAHKFIKERIAPAHPKNDGKQTPFRNHPVFVAQHATATCCRKCIEKWHGIKRGHKLTGKEIDYIVTIIMSWIEGQLLGMRENILATITPIFTDDI